MTFLTGKPIWMHWIFYVVLCGAIFGITFGIISLLALRWWIPVVAIIAGGMVWGTFSFKKAPPTPPTAAPEHDIMDE